jgi:hypothetical protein
MKTTAQTTWGESKEEREAERKFWEEMAKRKAVAR